MQGLQVDDPLGDRLTANLQPALHEVDAWEGHARIVVGMPAEDHVHQQGGGGDSLVVDDHVVDRGEGQTAALEDGFGLRLHPVLRAVTLPIGVSG